VLVIDGQRVVLGGTSQAWGGHPHARSRTMPILYEKHGKEKKLALRTDICERSNLSKFDHFTIHLFYFIKILASSLCRVLGM
jgi:hypothetical protein